MDFISFVKASTKQTDPGLLGFVNAIKDMNDIPGSSDPEVLGRYFYKKLNHLQTLGFQKWFMIYFATEPKREIPVHLSNEAAFLNAINHIVELQNNDPEYSDF